MITHPPTHLPQAAEYDILVMLDMHRLNEDFIPELWYDDKVRVDLPPPSPPTYSPNHHTTHPPYDSIAVQIAHPPTHPPTSSTVLHGRRQEGLGQPAHCRRRPLEPLCPRYVLPLSIPTLPPTHPNPITYTFVSSPTHSLAHSPKPTTHHLPLPTHRPQERAARARHLGLGQQADGKLFPFHPPIYPRHSSSFQPPLSPLSTQTHPTHLPTSRTGTRPPRTSLRTCTPSTLPTRAWSSSRARSWPTPPTTSSTPTTSGGGVTWKGPRSTLLTWAPRN